jgi:putative hemolysin
MSGIVSEMLFVLLLILASGFFTVAEMAVISARKSRLEESAKKGSRRAGIALELAQTPSRFLSTVQIGITFATILIGTVAGRNMTDGLSAQVRSLPGAGSYSDEISLALVVLAITCLTLVIGEFVPKRLALRYPDKIAMALAIPLRIFSQASAPLVRLLTLSTDAIDRLFGAHDPGEHQVTEEEIKMLVRRATQAGVLEKSEQNMFEAVLRFGDKTARALMTPRTRIAWLDLEFTGDQVRDKITVSGHSCFPVGSGGLDTVTGVVYAKDLLAHHLAGQALDLRALAHQPLFVPRTVTALEVLESFKKSGQHLALVVDEYGGIEGLLTQHDILKAIAGDIPFEGRLENPKAVQRADGSWLLDGMLSVDEFKEIFSLETLPGEKRDAYQTLGGFVFTQMGRIPSVAECFDWNGLRLEVVDMDGKRIDKVLVKRLQSPATISSEGKPASRPQSSAE